MTTVRTIPSDKVSLFFSLALSYLSTISVSCIYVHLFLLSSLRVSCHQLVSRLPHPPGISPFSPRRPASSSRRTEERILLPRHLLPLLRLPRSHLLLLLHFLLLAASSPPSSSSSSLRMLPSKAFCAMTSGNCEIYVERDTSRIYHSAKILRSTGFNGVNDVLPRGRLRRVSREIKISWNKRETKKGRAFDISFSELIK